MDNAYKKGMYVLCTSSYTAYTPTGKNNFVRAGRYGKIPHVGDVVYFYTSSLGRISHTGIVVTVKHNIFNGVYSIETIEGNTSAGKSFSRDGGEVAKKSYSFTLSQVGGTNRVNGFGTPKFGTGYCSAKDVVAVAKNEIGYIEKSSSKRIGNSQALSTASEKKADPGDGNYTKYGAFMGMNGVYWCHEFVNWCFYMACKLHNEVQNQTGWIKSGTDWTYQVNGVLVKNQ